MKAVISALIGLIVMCWFLVANMIECWYEAAGWHSGKTLASSTECVEGSWFKFWSKRFYGQNDANISAACQ